jgi:RimJ/RimL family protein N-acetyltransferase
MGWHIVNGPEVGHWVASAFDGGYFAERSEAIGLKKNGELIAGVIYENWNHKSIFCHIAFLGRITPSFLAAVFHYPFEVCDVEKIIAPIRGDNRKAINLVTKMGFSEEARIKDATPTGDLTFYTMTRNSCRFLRNRYGKKITRTAASA